MFNKALINVTPRWGWLALLVLWRGLASAATIAQTPVLVPQPADPNVMLTMSVEWPTAETAAYTDLAATDPAGICPGQTADTSVGGLPGAGPSATIGVCYYENQTYLGYFDPGKCYSYDPVNHRFRPAALADSLHECSGAWSGNLLNWATMTSLDEFRWALTGGSRDTDTAASGSTPATTVLVRSFKARGPNDYNMHVKRITPTATTVGSSTVPAVRSSKVTPFAVDAPLYLGTNGTSLYVWMQPGAAANTVKAGSTPVPAGANGQWIFDDVTGTTAPDGSGGGHPLTLPSSAATTTAGKSGAALLMNGWASGNGAVTSGPVLNTASSFSVSAWVRFDQLPSCTWQSVAGQDGVMDSGFYLQIVAACVTGQNPNFAFSMQGADSDAAPAYRIIAAQYPVVGTWYHLVGVRDVSAGMMYLYINGTLAGSLSNPTTWSAGGAFTVGRAKFSGGNRDPVFGAIDSVTTYPRALTASEVADLANAGGVLVNAGSGDPSVAVPADSANLLTAIGGYQVRVSVCDPGVSLEADCTAYSNNGNTSWKPAGLIQANAANTRFAVSSYLYDSSPSHNGGVLRSNMKYVGLQKKDPVNGATANANAEWDANGILLPNPNSADASASGLSCSAWPGCSGVINFINGFGYSAQNYMSYDALSELYYESLRYFAAPANGPTSSYVTAPWNSGGVTASEKDGFPVVSTWTDPIQYACQTNAIVTIGDSSTWCDFNLPGSSLSDSTKCGTHRNYSLATTIGGLGESWGGVNPDVTAFTNAVGTYEGMGSLGANWIPGRFCTYYISGLAWWAHTHSIRSVVNGQSVGSSLVNVNSYFVDVRQPGTVGTYGDPRNQYWLGAKYGGFTLHNTVTPELSPISTSDWSSNGTTPSNYFYANQPVALVSSLNRLFTSLRGSAGTFAASAASSATLQNGTQVFQPYANPGDWTGGLRAYDISSTGVLSSTYIDAAALLASPSAVTRVIVTSSDVDGSGQPFEWSTLTGSEQASLNVSVTGTSDTLGAARLAFLRGDATQEGQAPGYFRTRLTTKLGDIVHSAPVYVAGVKPDGSARAAMVYVGANDGMLHAFSAGAKGDTTTTTGTTLMHERFAFVPRAVFPNLGKLTAPGYSHQYFVDGSPAVVEAAIGNAARTILAGTLGAGGASVFAIDVTDPDAIAASESAAAAAVLWEFTSSQDADLGDTFSTPQIVKTAALDANGNNRWAVVVGNGYRPAQASGSTNIQAALFVLFLDHPKGSNTWVNGTDYVKLLTRVPAASTASPNGMSTPAVIPNGQGGSASIVYAGDLYGNLWKFDLSASNPANWKSALDGAGTATTPLFIAQTASGVAQPITTVPEVVALPGGGYQVMFGTGVALSTGDLSSTAVQSIYGIQDRLTTTQVAGRASSGSKLVQQQILSSGLTGSGAAAGKVYRAISTNPVNLSTNTGWYLDLIDTPTASPKGERMVFDPIIFRGRLYVTTVTPATSVCGGGTSWSLVLDPYTGGGPATPVYDLVGDGIFSGGNQLSLAFNGSTTQVYPGGIQSTQGIQSPALMLAAAVRCGSNNCHEDITAGNASTSLTSRLENDGPSNQRRAWREVVAP